jgi:Uma2 family endonuclease
MTVAAAPNTSERAPRLWPVSVRAYHALGELGLVPEKTELLYGQVYQKMSKSPYHAYLQQVLAEALRPVLSPQVHLRSEQPLTCADSEPEPDLAVVAGRNQDYRQEHPRTAESVVEVCLSSHDYDRSKLRAYASAGIKEVWLVLTPEAQIEVHRVPSGERFAERVVHGPGGRLTSSSVPTFTVDLAALFAR